MKQVWLVTAQEIQNTDVELEGPLYRHVFFNRDDAIALQRRGELEMPQLYWECLIVMADDLDYANYEFDLLKQELDDAHYANERTNIGD